MICANCKKEGKHSTTVRVDGKLYYLCDNCAFYIHNILKDAILVPINGNICFNFVGEKVK